MSTYNPNSIKTTYSDTKADLDAAFAKWGVKDWEVRPMRELDRRYHYPSDPAKVVVRYIKDGREVELSMAKHPYYYQNIRVIYFAIEALRMNEERGLEELVRAAYGLLPAPVAEKDPYETLGVRPDAPLDVIEASYRALAKKAHPDLGGSTQRMAELNAAWEKIKGGQLTARI